MYVRHAIARDSSGCLGIAKGSHARLIASGPPVCPPPPLSLSLSLSHHLCRTDVGHNQGFGDDGITALVIALTKSKSIKVVDLTDTYMTDESALAVVRQLRHRFGPLGGGVV